jgi:hypothetical protein
MWSEINNQIVNLRVRGAGADTPAIRLALAGLFSSIEIKPSGVHPTAILIIRHMMDPMPGTLMPHGGIMRVNPSWEKAMQLSLSEIYKDAERPVNGYISPNAKAVLFNDEGEILACLAMDMTRNEALSHWWWQVILKKLPSSSLEGLKIFLCKEPSYMPAFIRYLTEWGQAQNVLNCFSSAQIMTLLFALARTYGLSEFSLNSLKGIPVRNEILSNSTSSKVMQIYEKSEDLSSYNLKAPWDRWFSLKSFSHKLNKERLCLLGLGLSLHYYPFIVKSTAYKDSLHRWWAYAKVYTEQRVDNANLLSQSGQEANDKGEDKFKEKSSGKKSHQLPKGPFINLHPKPSFPPLSRAQTEHIVNIEKRGLISEQGSVIAPPTSYGNNTENINEHGSVSTPTRSYDDKIENMMEEGHIHKRGLSKLYEHEISSKDRRGLSEKQATREAEARKLLYHLPDSLSFTKSDANQVGPYPHIPNPSFRKGSLQDLSILKEAQTSREKSNTVRTIAASLLKEGVTTRLGGIFYLINMMQYLDLPTCFEEDWALSSQIGPWGTLEILGRALLGPSHEYLNDDPIWEALARLDGRKPGELPGKKFRGRDCFRLPAIWLDKIRLAEDRIFFWATNEKRLCIWSKKGYLLVDVPRNGEMPLKQAEAELLTYMGNTVLGSKFGNLKRKSFDHVPLARLSSFLMKRLNSDLARWVAMVLPYIIFCLRLALNIKDKKVVKGLQSITELGEMLLLYKGRLYVTSTHVDLVFGIDDISLPVRMAGFDCNPGWLPDFGRVVLFHFE